MNEYDYKASHIQDNGQSYASNEFFCVIELINQAIKMKRCIKFDYYMYSSNPEKTKLIFGRRSEKIFHPSFLFGQMAFTTL